MYNVYSHLYIVILFLYRIDVHGDNRADTKRDISIW